MTGMRRWLAAMFACLGLACGLASPGLAAYPERSVQFIVGYPPGGAIDTVARVVASKLSEKWGQAVVVVNRAGGDGAIASEAVASAKPDGYTVLWVNAAYTIIPSVSKLGYDPIKSLAPITEAAYGPGVLVLNPSVPVNTLKELAEYMKAHPGAITAGSSSGPAGTPYLQMKMLADQLGVECVIAPYAGGGRVMAALLGNEIQITFTAVVEAAEQMKAGKVKALAVSSKVRSSQLPDVPSVAEAGGLPEYDVRTWYGVLAPAATPNEILRKLHDDIAGVIHRPDVRASLTRTGIEPVGNSAEEFASEIVTDIPKWAALLKAVNLK